MDMNQIMQQAQQFQQRMSEVQDELAKRRISASVGGGMVTVVVNGKSELLELKVEKEVIDPEDPGMLQDLIVAAVNEAMKNARDEAQVEISKLTGGLNLNAPGLSSLFGG